MQKINIVCVGKLKEKFFSDAVNEYLKRLSRFASVTVRELAEKRTLREEAENILKELRGACVVLAVEGKKLSSEALAAELKKQYDRGAEVTFNRFFVRALRRSEKCRRFQAFLF